MYINTGEHPPTPFRLAASIILFMNFSLLLKVSNWKTHLAIVANKPRELQWKSTFSQVGPHFVRER